MTRLNRADASKREYGPREVFKTGLAFDRTAQIIAEHLEQTKEPEFMVSLYVNAAFAAELFLKCLLRRVRDPREGHKLQELFEALPAEDQAAIRESFNATPKRSFAHVVASGAPPELDVPFDYFLSYVGGTFEEWRYSYELHSPTDASGLPELVRAIRTRIEELEPGWR